MDKQRIEELALKKSMVGALILAAWGITMALVTSSSAIMLDGMFNFISGIMSYFFIVVSRFVQSNEHRLAIVAGLTIVAWLVATFVTRPESRETLEAFYRKIRPGGPGWRPLARAAPDVEPDRHLALQLVAALLAAGIVYLTLPGVGLLIFGDFAGAVLCLVAAATCAVGVMLVMRRVGWGEQGP